MTLLTICQNTADYVGFERPTSVVGNVDATARQLLVCAQREGKTLVKRGPWAILEKEHTFSTANGTASYALPSDFDRFRNDTQYNRADQDAMRGPLNAQQWQFVKSGIVSAGTQQRWRVKADSNAKKFFIDPTPTSTETIAYDYVSNAWCQSSGGSAQTAWAADTDTGILDELLLEMGVTWRFKQLHGLDYAEDFRDYQINVARALGADGGAPKLAFDNRYKSGVGPYSYNVPEANYGT
jgi:hypothetical protein